MKQPNPWSCYPTCVSIATGIEFDNLIDVIGHDGSKIVHPCLPPPFCHEAFVPTEIAFALLKFGYACVYIITRPQNQIICSQEKYKEYNIDPNALRTNYPSSDELKDYILCYDYPIILHCQRTPDKYHCLAY